MNDTLIEQYRRDPAGVILRIEAAARRARAQYIHQLLKQAAAALFGTRRSPETGPKRSFSGEKASCSP